MCKPDPIALLASFDDLGIARRDVGIEEDRGANAASVKDFDHPPNSDPYAIVAPSIIQWVRSKRRRRLPDARRRLVDFEMLDIEPDIERDLLPVRPHKLRAIDDW